MFGGCRANNTRSDEKITITIYAVKSTRGSNIRSSLCGRWRQPVGLLRPRCNWYVRWRARGATAAVPRTRLGIGNRSSFSGARSYDVYVLFSLSDAAGKRFSAHVVSVARVRTVFPFAQTNTHTHTHRCHTYISAKRNIRIASENVKTNDSATLTVFWCAFRTHYSCHTI